MKLKIGPMIAVGLVIYALTRTSASPPVGITQPYTETGFGAGVAPSGGVLRPPSFSGGNLGGGGIVSPASFDSAVSSSLVTPQRRLE